MILGLSLAAVLVFMSLVFLLSQRLKRLDVVDAAWGPAFVVVGLAGFWLGDQTAGLNVASLVNLLVILWAGRLAYHIIRRLNSHGEDPRYVELKHRWRGRPAVNAYLRVFLVQAGLAWLIALPVSLINRADSLPLGGWALAGGLVWLAGWVIEAVSDRQLSDFVKQPANRGRIMSQGLWRYSRHPNYFGELTQWWGVFIIALAVPVGWLGFIGPLTLTFLILLVSGIPLNESRQAKKPGWKDYRQRTSVLVPLPPRK